MATRTVRPRTVGAMTDEEREQSNRRQAELESMRAAANPALASLRKDREAIGEGLNRLGIDLDDPLVKAVYRVIACAENALLDVEQAASSLHQLDNVIRRYP